jgi:hypothetical protein
VKSSSSVRVGSSETILVTVTVVIAALAGFSIYKILAQPELPKPLAHTLEYNAVVAEHIDLNKVPRASIDLTTIHEDLSPHFSVYRFRHSQLRGKWGYLHVFVDRDKSTTIPRSLWDINGKPPIISESGNCSV